MSKAQHTRVGHHAVIVMAVLAAACAKPGSNEGSVDTSAADSVQLLASNYLVGPPGAHQSNTKYYIEHSIDFGGKTKADSAYTGPFDCATCEKTPVTLTIVPEEKSYKVDWNYAFRNTKRRGYIVAKIFNDDAVEYKPLKLAAGDSAYLWVGPISADGNDRAVAFYKIASDGKVIDGPMQARRILWYCDNPKWEQRSRAAAKGEHEGDGPCYEVKYPGGTAPAAAKNIAYHTVSYSNMMLRANGAWLSCVYGCCEVGALDAPNEPPGGG